MADVIQIAAWKTTRARHAPDAAAAAYLHYAATNAYCTDVSVGVDGTSIRMRLPHGYVSSTIRPRIRLTPYRVTKLARAVAAELAAAVRAGRGLSADRYYDEEAVAGDALRALLARPLIGASEGDAAVDAAAEARYRREIATHLSAACEAGEEPLIALG